MPSTEPKLVQVAVTRSAGGKVAITKYGNITSDYFVSASRTYSIPEDWTNDQVDEFQLAESITLREVVDEQAQIEFEERWSQSTLNPENPDYAP